MIKGAIIESGGNAWDADWLVTDRGQRFARRPCQQWQTENKLVPDVTTRVLTAHVPIPLAEKVDQLAARLDRSRGWIIRQALAAWIEQEEARNRSPLEAPGTLDARHEV